MSRARGWTCRRISQSIVCGHHNQPRTRKCARCGKSRPPRRQPAHMTVLKALDYADFIAINGGSEACGICGTPKRRRRHDRDHDHLTGNPRGLLCFRCNRHLPAWVTPMWLRAAADYLDRAQQRSVTR